jgi:hypothetical protein
MNQEEKLFVVLFILLFKESRKFLLLFLGGVPKSIEIQLVKLNDFSNGFGGGGKY